MYKWLNDKVVEYVKVENSDALSVLFQYAPDDTCITQSLRNIIERDDFTLNDQFKCFLMLVLGRSENCRREYMGNIVQAVVNNDELKLSNLLSIDVKRIIYELIPEVISLIRDGRCKANDQFSQLLKYFLNHKDLVNTDYYQETVELDNKDRQAIVTFVQAVRGNDSDEKLRTSFTM